MRVIETVAEMRTYRRMAESAGRSVGLVPTMGALHGGHLSLVHAAQSGCDSVVVSIFVNPTQFAPHEDLARYPRTFAADCALLERAGVDVVFAPGVEAMYPTGAQTWVDVPEIGSRLDGASRPHHFRGVATVVTKLFNIVQPARAYFGQKDAAQVAVLQRMVRDLLLEVELVVCPTVREAEGLAMSSRNRYLSADERTCALVLSRVLRDAERRVASGERCVRCLREAMLHELNAAPGITVEYAEIVDAATLEPLSELRDGALAAVAANIGGTRLIDNVVLGTGWLR